MGEREKAASSPSNLQQVQSTQQPLVKIGHYILGETLGVGTFGKVKSKYSRVHPQVPTARLQPPVINSLVTKLPSKY